MKLHFLGTCAGAPSKHRNVSSIALNLLSECGEIWLFDCGEATQHQILHTAIKPRQICRVFITHLHGDHIFGLLGWLCSRSVLSGENPPPLRIYAPVGIRQFIEVGLLWQKPLNYDLEIVELSESDFQNGEIRLILSDNQIRTQVYATLLTHGVPCYGYRVVESDHSGSLKVDKLKQLGITDYTVYRDLKQGRDVILPNGAILKSTDFTENNIKGREVVILGDTRYQASLVDFCRGADVLVHESTYLHDRAELAHERFHSTSVQAAQLAQLSGVKCLYLNHISARYQGDSLNQLLTEAQQIFPNTHLAHDFLEVAVNLDK